jgi:hypothetical protein
MTVSMDGVDAVLIRRSWDRGPATSRMFQAIEGGTGGEARRWRREAVANGQPLPLVLRASMMLMIDVVPRR